ncbi:MAG: beta-galactosidase trimerization domain-containing protein [Anaerolineae bacterium]|nr:beta-galactosidase trimerization domain-containing protein [Anaerolineae bacterium]
MVSLACGNAPLYCMANRFFYGIGSGSAEPAREVFDFMRAHERLIKDSAPAPYVTVVTSWDALRLWQHGGATYNMEMSEGFALAMLDARVSVDVYPNTELNAEWLKGQRVIALCGASGLSDADAALLADWVRDGGALLATWDTGLYDEDGVRRADGGALRDVLGVEMTGAPLPSRPDCYVRVTDRHPALGEYGPGAQVMGDARNVPLRVRAGATVVAEMWDLGFDQSRGPAIVVNRYGKGKAVYISGSLENYYTVSRVAALRRLLASIVRWLGDDAPQPFGLAAPRGVYGLLRRAVNGDPMLWVLAPVGFRMQWWGGCARSSRRSPTWRRACSCRRAGRSRRCGCCARVAASPSRSRAGTWWRRCRRCTLRKRCTLSLRECVCKGVCR